MVKSVDQDDGMEEVFKMATDFFADLHVSQHNASNKKTVVIPDYFFFKLQPLETKE